MEKSREEVIKQEKEVKWLCIKYMLIFRVPLWTFENLDLNSSRFTLSHHIPKREPLEFIPSKVQSIWMLLGRKILKLAMILRGCAAFPGSGKGQAGSSCGGEGHCKVVCKLRWFFFYLRLIDQPKMMRGREMRPEELRPSPPRGGGGGSRGHLPFPCPAERNAFNRIFQRWQLSQITAELQQFDSEFKSE